MSGILAEIVATGTACFAGYHGFRFYLESRTKATRIKKIKGLHGTSASAMSVIECPGLSKNILASAIAMCSRFQKGAGKGQSTASIFVKLASKGYNATISKSGLQSSLNLLGYCEFRKKNSLMLGAICAVLGYMFTVELAAIGCLAGIAIGWMLLPNAIKQQIESRKNNLESHLSEMLEVLVLGLRSGMAFDQAFLLYCNYFNNSFSSACKEAYTQWSMGLVTRDQALRALSQSYDSEILTRIVNQIIRGLRFGNSLAQHLESSAYEVRNSHKSNVEEKVAKAPVKMLIPVGTLILPAMLIFILGPVLLELM